MRPAVLIFSLFLFAVEAFSKEDDDLSFLIQGAGYYEQWGDSSHLAGGGAVGNIYLNRYFSMQFVVQGDREKGELSPGFILAPIGALILATHNGTKVDSLSVLKTIGIGFLFAASILENPCAHIPVNDHLDIGISAHFLRFQISRFHEFQPKAGVGAAFNFTPGKHLTITPYAELNTRWEDRKPIGVQTGIRIGGRW